MQNIHHSWFTQLGGHIQYYLNPNTCSVTPRLNSANTIINSLTRSLYLTSEQHFLSNSCTYHSKHKFLNTNYHQNTYLYIVQTYGFYQIIQNDPSNENVQYKKNSFLRFSLFAFNNVLATELTYNITSLTRQTLISIN